MEIQEEKINELKQQLLNQINSNFPEDKKQPLIEKINSMSNSEFIEFAKINNIVQVAEPEQLNNSNNSEIEQETPFRQIVSGNLPSYKINENSESIAVLEINPISMGHTIIIPKKPVYEPSNIPKQVLELAEKISIILAKKLNPKEVMVKPSSILGEIIINVLPQYQGETLESQRSQGKPEELQALLEVLNKTEKKPEKKPEVKKEKIYVDSKESKKIIIPKRIP